MFVQVVYPVQALEYNHKWHHFEIRVVAFTLAISDFKASECWLEKFKKGKASILRKFSERERYELHY